MGGDHERTKPSRYRETVDSAPNGVVSVTPEFEVSGCNRVAQDRLGTDPVGESVWELFPDAEGTVVRAELETAVETGRQGSFLRYDPETAGWSEVWVYPDDHVTGIVDGPNETTVESDADTGSDSRVDGADPDERSRRGAWLFLSAPARSDGVVRTDDALAPSRDDIGVGNWEVDLRTGTLWWSEEIYRIRGLSPENDPTVEKELGFYHPEDRRLLEDAMDQLEADEKMFDLELREVTDDGAVRWVRTTGVPQYDGDDIVALRGVYRDVTERRRRENQLETLKRAVGAAPIGITLSDPTRADTPVTYANRAFLATTGYDRPTVLGGGFDLLYGEATDSETVETLEATIEAGNSDTIEFRNYRADGTPFWNRVTVAPVTDEAGTTTDYVGFHRDVTERRRSKRRLEEQRDGLELLTRMVSHDLANDLEPIRGFAQLLRADHVDEAGHPFLDRIVDGANHANALLHTTRDLTEAMLRPTDGLEPLALDEALSTQVETVRSTYPDAVVRTDGPTPEVDVLADPLLDSVFRNLLGNAVIHNHRAVPEVLVSTAVTDGSVSVSIVDNGPGIPDDRKEAVFGRDEKGLDSPGTGLGLYLVDTLVDRYGGRISVLDRAETAFADAFTRVETSDDRSDASGAVFVVELIRR